MQDRVETVRRCAREAVKASRYQLLAFIDCSGCGRTHAVDVEVEHEREFEGFGWER